MKMFFIKHYVLKNNAIDIDTDSSPYQLVLLSVVCLFVCVLLTS